MSNTNQAVAALLLQAVALLDPSAVALPQQPSVPVPAVPVPQGRTSSKDHCQAPKCGLFVRKGATFCSNHFGTLPVAQAPQVTYPAPVPTPQGMTLPRPIGAPQAPQARKDTALTRETKDAFVKAALAQGIADYRGLSTKAIAQAIVVQGFPVPSGFRLGQGYRKMFA